MRQCGTCKKCCEGWLSGEVKGIEFGNKKPCAFKCNSGCSIYQTRPKFCKDFKCEWLNGNLPEQMKPDVCNIIVSKKDFGEFKRYEFVKAGEADINVLNELTEWAVKNAICHAVI